MDTPVTTTTFRFGEFELDVKGGELRRNGVRRKLQPQPFKLLVLLLSRAGTLVTREEIRGELWPDGTFVDFDQAVNFAVKQIRDVLRDIPDRPLYIETIPKRGYKFIAPVHTGPLTATDGRREGTTTIRLQKALWTNIAELRIAEEKRRRYTLVAGLLTMALLVTLVIFFATSR
jgi:DNA-binding winged helix-turn-helix (wHTH) protein